MRSLSAIQAVVILVACLLLLSIGVRCSMRTVTDETGAPSYARSTGPWSVEGVRLGQSLPEVKALLGEPSKQITDRGRAVYFWKTRGGETSVSFDAKERVVEIFGQSLSTVDRKPMLWSNQSESEVVQILGEGRMKKQYRPKGSGVISLGRELVGISHEYTDDNARYEVWVYENQFRSVRVLPLSAPAR